MWYCKVCDSVGVLVQQNVAKCCVRLYVGECERQPKVPRGETQLTTWRLYQWHCLQCGHTVNFIYATSNWIPAILPSRWDTLNERFSQVWYWFERWTEVILTPKHNTFSAVTNSCNLTCYASYDDTNLTHEREAPLCGVYLCTRTVKRRVKYYQLIYMQCTFGERYTCRFIPFVGKNLWTAADRQVTRTWY